MRRFRSPGWQLHNQIKHFSEPRLWLVIDMSIIIQEIGMILVLFGRPYKVFFDRVLVGGIG